MWGKPVGRCWRALHTVAATGYRQVTVCAGANPGGVPVPSPCSPQDREARRQPALSRPHMPGSRQERIRLRLELERRAAEEAGLVDW